MRFVNAETAEQFVGRGLRISGSEGFGQSFLKLGERFVCRQSALEGICLGAEEKR